jgi:phosphatidylinositol glycan class B
MNLLVFFILFRLLNSLIARTWFSPDEYWQSQEVAHKLAFGFVL